MRKPVSCSDTQPDVSHELRTPLTLILGPVLELSRSSKLPPAALADLGIVERNARRLLRLVNTIMDFATAEAGRMTARFMPTLIGSFTTDLASAFRSASELAGLRYDVDCATRVPAGLLVWVDRDKYEKIIYNLLSNAIKYTVEGEVAVHAHVDQEHFVLEVRDTGVGIPRDELGSVFDKFQRASSVHGQGRTIEGTGIGLSYTLELVKMHQGRITVESEPGVGSTFRVFLPLGKDHLPAAYVVEDDGHSEYVQSPPVETPHYLVSVRVKSIWLCAHVERGQLDDVVQMVTPSETGTNEGSQSSGGDVLWQPLIFGNRARARILLADDNADMRRYVGGLLARYCDVVPCADGARALAELRTRRREFDLVLSDDMMPNMSGAELLDAVRADPALRAIPFIMISARAGDEARMEGLSRGADDYLAKPFKARELMLRLHTQLQSASVRNELELRMNEHLQRLEESKESFTNLCDRLQVGVHRSDPQGTLTWSVSSASAAATR
jgi:CheY-like chemotaxis protein